jgi:hypothetical protein
MLTDLNHNADSVQPVPDLFLSNITVQPLQWLWPNRIPFAHLTLLHGAPGIGLSLLSLHLAACVSAGRPLPDGSPCPQGNVILISPFDAPAHTIKPRLEAAGGNPPVFYSLTPFPPLPPLHPPEPPHMHRLPTLPLSALSHSSATSTTSRQLSVVPLLASSSSILPTPPAISSCAPFCLALPISLKPPTALSSSCVPSSKLSQPPSHPTASTLSLSSLPSTVPSS